MDRYDEIESECGHSECTAKLRVQARMIDLVDGGDDRLHALLHDLADEIDSSLVGALVATFEHWIMERMQEAVEDAMESSEGLGLAGAPPALLKAMGARLRREGIIAEALQEAPHQNPQNN